MQVIFRDKFGMFSVDHVEMVQYCKEENKWVVFFENDGKEEYIETELETVIKN